MKNTLPMLGAPRPSSRPWCSAPAAPVALMAPGQVALIAPKGSEQGTGLPVSGSSVALLPVVPSAHELSVLDRTDADRTDADRTDADRTGGAATYTTHDVRTSFLLLGLPPRGAPV